MLTADGYIGVQRTFVVDIGNASNPSEDSDYKDEPPPYLMTSDLGAQSPEKYQKGELHCPQTSIEENIEGHYSAEERSVPIDEPEIGFLLPCLDGVLLVQCRCFYLPSYCGREQHRPGRYDQAVVGIEPSK